MGIIPYLMVRSSNEAASKVVVSSVDAELAASTVAINAERSAKHPRPGPGKLRRTFKKQLQRAYGEFHKLQCKLILVILNT
jgi:hypothetical protein